MLFTEFQLAVTYLISQTQEIQTSIIKKIMEQMFKKLKKEQRSQQQVKKRGSINCLCFFSKSTSPLILKSLDPK